MWLEWCLYIFQRNYSDDAYILACGAITVPSTAASFVAAVNATEKVIFQNCVPFTDCISEKKDA